MLRNIIGPLFNFNLDHFLTLEFCYFFVFFCFFVFWAETPIFIVFSAKMQNWKKHKKETKTLFVNTTVLTAFVKMSVFFLHFSFLLFFQFPFFQRCFLTGFQKSKNNKIAKQEEQKNNNNQKTRCKAKRNEMLWFKTTQDNKQKNKNKRTSWNKKANTTKRKSKNQKEKMKNRKEGRKKRTRERQRKRKGRKGGGPKKAKEKQRETLKNKQKCPFLGGKTGFFVY